MIINRSKDGPWRNDSLSSYLRFSRSGEREDYMIFKYDIKELLNIYL